MARCELDALCWHQVDEGVVRLGQVAVHSLHHFVGGMGPVTASTLGCTCCTMLPPPSPARAPRQPVTITLPFSASASPMVSRLSLTASSMKPQVLTMTRSAPVIGLGGLVALCAQLGQDEFGIGQRLGTAQTDKADFGGTGARRGTRIHSSPDCLRHPKDSTLEAHGCQHLLAVLLHLLLHLREGVT
jgi:hypothetical protein